MRGRATAERERSFRRHLPLDAPTHPRTHTQGRVISHVNYVVWELVEGVQLQSQVAPKSRATLHAPLSSVASPWHMGDPALPSTIENGSAEGSAPPSAHAVAPVPVLTTELKIVVSHIARVYSKVHVGLSTADFRIEASSSQG